METYKKSLNVEGGFLFCGGWNFSKSVSVDSTFIREMRVCMFTIYLQIWTTLAVDIIALWI